MRSSDISTLLSATIASRLPVLITGAPGIGKTALTEQAAHAAGCELIVSHPVVSDPTDFKGLPWPNADKGEATFLPFGELAQAINTPVPTVWLLDDLGQASAGVQAAAMQLLLARRINGHKLPDHVTFVACTNRRQDRAGVSGVLEPVKSRFAAIVELEANVDDWCTWAFTTDFIPAELVAFLRNRPELLHQFAPSADITNTPSPRTWANLARLQMLGLPKSIQLPAFVGAVGEGAAVEYSAFLEMVASMVSIDNILLNPDTADIPKKPGELYAVAAGLAYRANTQTFGRIATYCERLNNNGHGEFAVLTVRDSTKRVPAITATSPFTKLASGPLGRLVTGVLE